MKILILLGLAITSAHALECELVGERKFNRMKEEMVLEGKGITEINDILRARINICQGQCGPVTGLGLCMAKINKGKN